MLREPDWVSPTLWRNEFRNAVVKCLRGRVLELGMAHRIMAAAEMLMSGREFDIVSDDVIELAASSGCSAYDAEFVVLARDLHAPLVTTDKELLKKFPEIAVAPEAYLAR